MHLNGHVCELRIYICENIQNSQNIHMESVFGFGANYFWRSTSNYDCAFGTPDPKHIQHTNTYM